MNVLRRYLPIILTLVLAGCAGLGLREPIKVSVAGLESLPSEGLEARFAVKLRVQNPNDTPLRYDGVSLDLELAGKDFGSGVSDQRGTVPRYGEAVLTVPVTVPVTAIIRQVFSMTDGRDMDRIQYRLHGRLGGIGVYGASFDSQGELVMPRDPGRVNF